MTEYQDLSTVVEYKEATAADWQDLSVPITLNMVVLATDTGEFKVGDGNRFYNQLDVAFTLDMLTEVTALSDKVPVIGTGNAGKVLLVNGSGTGYELSSTLLNELSLQDDWDSLSSNKALSSHNHDELYVTKEVVDTVIDAVYQNTMIGQDPLSYVILHKMQRDEDQLLELPNSIADEFNDILGIDSESLNYYHDKDCIETEPWYREMARPGVERYYWTTVVANDKIYAFGGTEPGYARSDELFIYDIANDMWSQGSKGPSARFKHSAVIIGQYMYVLGGYPASGIAKDFYIYDTLSDVWEQLTDHPIERSGMTMVVYGGKIYVYGGADADSNELNTLHVYDPSDDVWTELTANVNDTTGRQLAVAGVIGNKMYVYGGYDGTSNLNTLHVYNLDTDIWSVLTPNTKHTDGCQRASSVVINDMLYVVGIYNYISIYDPDTGTWSYEYAGLSEIISLSLSYYKNKIYMLGGIDTDKMTTYNLTKDLSFESITKNTDTQIAASRTYVRGVLPELNDNVLVEVSRDGGTTYALTELEESILTEGWDIKAYSGSTEFDYIHERLTADLSLVSRQNHKGSVTGFIVDTANTYAHTDVAIDDTYIGSQIVTASGNIIIKNVVGDGTSAASIEFTGILAVGPYSIVAIYRNSYTVDEVVSPYNFQDFDWSSSVPPLSGRRRHMSTTIGNKLYIYGGVADNTEHFNDLWEYDLTNTTWTQLAFGPIGRYGGTLISYEDKLYLFGGVAVGDEFANDTYVYDTTTNVWTELTSCPVGRAAFAGVRIGNKVYIYGGHDGVTRVAYHYAYDLINDTWTQLADGPDARNRHATAVVNNKMYVYGGINDSSAVLNTLYVYYPETDNWVQLTDGPGAREGSTLTNIDNQLYLFGGYNDPTYYNTIYKYNPIADTWTPVQDGPAGMNIHTANMLNYKLYIYGGYDGSTKNTLYVSDIFTNSIKTISKFPLTISTADTDIMKITIDNDYKDDNYSMVKEGSEYKIFSNDAWVTVVRDNAGTWEYRDAGEVFVPSAINTDFGAIEAASNISINRMTITELESVRPGIIDITNIVIIFPDMVSTVSDIHLSNKIPTTIPEGSDIKYRIRSIDVDDTISINGIRVNYI